MNLSQVITDMIDPAYALLPARMASTDATVQLLATGLQESRFEHRRQMGNGPARSFWQFERGGGVKGVMSHPSSADQMRALCDARGVPFTAMDVWTAMETDDVLAAGASRLLYWTDPKPIPSAANTGGDAWAQAGWALYLRTWRPGKPHPETWAAYHMAARRALGV